MDTPYRVGILGATGVVGQRLIRLLQQHPWFRLQAVAASERSTGRRYLEASRWALAEEPPPAVAGMRVRAARADALEDCDVVLSALDSAVAREVEPEFRAAGFAVISNSSTFRQHEDVPLVIPEVNLEHLSLARAQSDTHGGFIVTNPNCSTTGLAMVLAPLHRRFGLRRVVVSTLQAISGAGSAGPRALELTDNVLPYIAGEEDKLESELGKILGRRGERGVERLAVSVSAHCHRVPVLDGHLEAVSLELEQRPAVEDIVDALAGFPGLAESHGLPTAPAHPIVVRAEPDRPQPRLDRDCGAGMSVVVGRVRPCPVLGWKLVLLSHNTLRGAAGGTLLNAEALAVEGLLARRRGR
jgi:aspartate-semialdehyde dehydrogenase